MLRSIKATVKDLKISIAPSGRENKEKAGFNTSDRPFLELTRQEEKELTKSIESELSKQINKIFK